VRRPACAALAALLAGACGDPPAKEAPPSIDAAAFADAFALKVPRSTPRGDPVALPRRWPAGSFRTRGTFSYAHRATGRFEPGVSFPARRIEGRIDVVRRAEGDAPMRAVLVEGTLETREWLGEGSPTSSTSRVRLEFHERGGGGAERKEIRWKGVPPGLDEVVENVQALWTEPLPVPNRPVRPGEVWNADEGPDLEPVQRAAWSAYRERDPSLPQVVTPILGAAWIEAVEKDAGVDVALVRLRLRQGDVQPLDRPDAGAKRSLGYAAALDRDRRVDVATGVTRSYDSTWRTRLRYQARDAQSGDADYVVDVEQRAQLTTVPH
jgi:hypothetical protein